MTFGGQGTILIDDQLTNAGSQLDAVLCHEFFHILEYAQAPNLPDVWITEASAVWAETIYVPESQDAAGFFPSFQKMLVSLDSSSYPPPAHEYGAAVWLTWLTQEVAKDATGVAGRSAVFELWHAFGDVTSTVGDVDAIINSRYPWATDYPDFSIEDLDDPQLSPEVTPYLFDQAASQFQIAVPPKGIYSQTLNAGTVKEAPPAIPPLSSYFEYYDSVASGVKYIKFDFSAIEGADADDIVLADVSGRWERFDVTGSTKEFCFHNGPVSRFYIMLDNHGTHGAPSVTGKFIVDARSDCPCPSAGAGPRPGARPPPQSPRPPPPRPKGPWCARAPAW